MFFQKQSLAICAPSYSTTLMRLFRLGLEDDPWEVVTSKTICPLPMDMCFDDSGKESCFGSPLKPDSVTFQELDQLLVAKIHYMIRYDREVKNDVSLALELQNAVIAAQQLLLERVKQNGCHVLVSERLLGSFFFGSLFSETLNSWGLTLFRRGKYYRIRVEYRARRKLLPCNVSCLLIRRY